MNSKGHGGGLGSLFTEGAVSDDEPVTQQWLRFGRYEGSDDDIGIVLRVDPALGVVSADISFVRPCTGVPPSLDYVASIRTEPGREVSMEGGPYVVVAQDTLGVVATGRLTLVPAGSGAVEVTLNLDQKLNGLPLRRDFGTRVEWVREELRDIGLEIETESGVAPIASFDPGDGPRTLETVLRDAGFRVVASGLPDEVPVKQGGWDTGELHDLMVDLADVPMDVPDWRLSLLLLSRATEPRLSGIMFDTTPTLPRQGLAVFASSIRAIPGVVPDRKLIQTTVHELGHALNLAHRFEREVGRADSLSHMAYDWRYLGGNHQQEFWQGYRFQYDPDELAFIRHAPREQVVPGGAPFRSIRYWADGDGGYSPYVPEEALPEFELKLTPPPAPVFQFGQPVLLSISLTNRSGTAITVPPRFLDPKTGFVEVLIRRHRTDDPSGLRGAASFTPILQRCFDMSDDAAATLRPNETLRDNLNLTFGSSGFSFAEPGSYDVTVLLVVPVIENNVWKRDRVAKSNTLRIQVAHPTQAAEVDLANLFDAEVGTYFALGGSRALTRAAGKLDEVSDRRDDDPADPVVANILRCKGIDAQRAPVRYDVETGFTVERSDRERALTHLTDVMDAGLDHFDPVTADSTRALAASLT